MAATAEAIGLTGNQGTAEGSWRSDWDLMTISKKNLESRLPIERKEFINAINQNPERVYQEIAGLMDNARENLCRIRAERDQLRVEKNTIPQ
ncbi:hypothetical protein ACJ73_09513 [Blastomyces percursus]|uniref:Uncharacterized protein n=1 Tax=Blastomyces percursus TaxID=1658174 RepID=A0A1J9PUM8_9EURO|nr:hypothetical protein ACJ73_09513 [Blastomyces percursus]